MELIANMLADDDPERVCAHLGPNADRIALAKPGFVQKLVASQRDEIIRHLQLLSPHDRWLRFGAPKTDASIDKYVHGIDFARDKVFGIFEPDLALTGVAHLALDVEREAAELALGRVRSSPQGLRLHAARVRQAAREEPEVQEAPHALARGEPGDVPPCTQGRHDRRHRVR